MLGGYDDSEDELDLPALDTLDGMGGTSYGGGRGDDSYELFLQDPLLWKPDVMRQGTIVTMALGKKQMVIGTSHRKVIILGEDGITNEWDVPKSKSAMPSSLDSSSVGSSIGGSGGSVGRSTDSIHKIFCDLTVRFIIVCLRNGNNYFLNPNRKGKLTTFKDLRGHIIDSCFFDRSGAAESSGPILMGTSNGEIWQCEINEGKITRCLKLYDLRQRRYCGIPDGSSSSSSGPSISIGSGSVSISGGDSSHHHHSSSISSAFLGGDDESYRVGGIHVEYLTTSTGKRKSLVSRGGLDITVDSTTSALAMTGLLDSDDDDMSGIGPPLSSSFDKKKKTTTTKLTSTLYVVITTPSKIFEFIGGPSFNRMFQEYSGASNYRQIASSGDHTALTVYQSKDGSTLSEAIGWLTSTGVVISPLTGLARGSQLRPNDSIVGDRVNEDLILFGSRHRSSVLSGGGSGIGTLGGSSGGSALKSSAVDEDWAGMEGQIPIGLSITKFHVILVYDSCFLAVNRLSKRCVFSEMFPAGDRVRAVTSIEADRCFVACEQHIYQIVPHDEERDVWSLYLERGDFPRALEYCRSNVQKQKVLRAEADHYFDLGNFTESAKKYAHLWSLSTGASGRSSSKPTSSSVTGTAAADVMSGISVSSPTTVTTEQTARPYIRDARRQLELDIMDLADDPSSLEVSFEEIALKFLDANVRDALMVYLEETLKRTSIRDKTQRTILATWLCELHLAKCNEYDAQMSAKVFDGRRQFGGPSSSKKKKKGRFQKRGAKGTYVSGSSSESSSGNSVKLMHTDPTPAFHEFLSLYRQTLMEAQLREVIFGLISGHGRTDDLIEFGKICNDYGWVLRHYVQNELYKEAIATLALLKGPSSASGSSASSSSSMMTSGIDGIIGGDSDHAELFYAFAPVLMQVLPKETVDMLIATQYKLDPLKLVPSLMRFGPMEDRIITTSMSDRSITMIMDDEQSKQQQSELEINKLLHSSSSATTSMLEMESDFQYSVGESSSRIRGKGQQQLSDMNQEHRIQAIRFLENAIFERKCKDAALHNYLVTLYCQLGDESALLKMIERTKSSPKYDIKYALRMCHEYDRRRACVKLYQMMELYIDAAMVALKIDSSDLSMCKSIADDWLRKKPLINKTGELKQLWLSVARVVIVQKHAQDIDLILQLIRVSKCLSIEDILPMMNDFTEIGPFKDEIKKSLQKYSSRIAKLQTSMKSYTENAEQIRRDTEALKNRSAKVMSNKKCDLSDEPILGHEFVLFPCQHVFKLGVLIDHVFSLKMKQSRISSMSAVIHSKSQLSEMVCEECPLCGQMMIDQVYTPFVDPSQVSDQRAQDSWLISDPFAVPEDATARAASLFESTK